MPHLMSRAGGGVDQALLGRVADLLGFEACKRPVCYPVRLMWVAKRRARQLAGKNSHQANAREPAVFRFSVA